MVCVILRGFHRGGRDTGQGRFTGWRSVQLRKQICNGRAEMFQSDY